jgi:hypothetical protein
MTGWTRRRSSGEIINATLLEVFLALVFMVFALAIFEQQRANAALTPEDAVTLRKAVIATRDSLNTARRVARARFDSLTIANQTIAKFRFDSPHPPDCEPGARPAWLVTVTLAGPGQLTVVAHRAIKGLEPGVQFTVPTGEFRSRFANLRDASEKQGCRYFALIKDTPNMPKAEYKAAMSAITSIFRFRGAFQ